MYIHVHTIFIGGTSEPADAQVRLYCSSIIACVSLCCISSLVSLISLCSCVVVVVCLVARFVLRAWRRSYVQGVLTKQGMHISSTGPADTASSRTSRPRILNCVSACRAMLLTDLNVSKHFFDPPWSPTISAQLRGTSRCSE